MKRRLLNTFKNLIIVLLLVLVFVNIPTKVFAEDVSFNRVVKLNISGWYFIIRNISIAIMLIVLIVVGIKSLILQMSTPEENSVIKKNVGYWIFCLFLIMFMPYIMSAMISINENAVNFAKDIGYSISGVEELENEVTLFEAVKTKAYEIKFTSGMTGMIIYIALVVYSYLFVFIYAIRFFMIMLLFLLGPLVFVYAAYLKTFGKSGVIRDWFKEVIYYIFIQILHAVFYSICIGLTLKLIESNETFIFAFITLIAFGTVIWIDRFIRDKFAVGNIISDIRGVAEKVKQTSLDVASLATSERTETVSKLKSYVGNKAVNVKNSAVKFKNNVIAETNKTVDALDGSKVKVTSAQIEKERRKMENPSLPGKIFNEVQGATINLAENLKGNLNQTSEMMKRLKGVIKSHDKKIKNKIFTGYDKIYQTVINTTKSSKQVALDLKNCIQNTGSDLVATVYSVEGPQAFIYPEVGSPYMGMLVLSSENYGVGYGNSNRNIYGVKTLKSKKYKFVRFNGKSVKTITHGLNRRLILNNEYLKTMSKVSGVISSGNLIPKTYSAMESKLIKYTAKLNSTIQRKHMADMQLESYMENKQDSNWANLTSVAMDIKSLRNTRISAELLKVAQESPEDIVVNQLIDMGQVRRVDENTVIAFGEEAQKSLGVISEESLEEKSENSKILNKEEKKDSLETMTDLAIINTAIYFGVSNLEELDMQNPEVKIKILDELVEKGIVNVKVKENEKAEKEILEAILERKDLITNEEYVDVVMQKELAEIYKKDGLPQDINEEVYVEGKLGDLSKLVLNIAQKEVLEQTKRVFEELQINKDTIQENIDTAKEILDLSDVPEEAKNKVKSVAENALNKAQNIAQNTLREVNKKTQKVIREITGTSNENDSTDEVESDNMLTFYIYGEVLYEGKYEIKIGGRIYEAIKIAGGVTENADLMKISYYDTVTEGQTIVIPSRNNDEDVEEMLKRCMPIVEEEIKKYIVENNISNVEALRKLVHKNMIIAILQKALKNENVTKKQIEGLIEERIKEIEKIRELFDSAKGNAKVVNRSDIRVSKDNENIENERERRQKIIENKYEKELDNMIENIVSDVKVTDEEPLEGNGELARLLEEMKEDGEKILVNRLSRDTNKQEIRSMYIKESPKDKMNMLLGRF